MIRTHKAHDDWFTPPPNERPDPAAEQHVVRVTAGHAKDVEDLKDLLGIMGLEVER